VFGGVGRNAYLCGVVVDFCMNEVMNLNERIIAELRKTKVNNIDRLIDYMNGDKGFFWVRCGGHDHWTNGTAQHSWRVYQYMRYLWEHPDEIRSKDITNPSAVRNLTELQIILTALLHDVGKMRGGYHHATNSKNIIEEYLGKDFTEKYPEVVAAIFFHHNKDKDGRSLNAHRNCLLRILLNMADSMASGTAWNSTRCKQSRSQHSGSQKDAMSYRRNALDRTRQTLIYHMFLDSDYNFHHFSNYPASAIRWNEPTTIPVPSPDAGNGELSKVNGVDFVTAAHNLWKETGEKPCIVVRIKSSVLSGYQRKLRQDSRDEEELLICSNLLLAFYTSQSGSGHKYEYMMRPEIIDRYQHISADTVIVLDDVTFVRDGESEGYRMVEPWMADVVLVPVL